MPEGGLRNLEKREKPLYHLRMNHEQSQAVQAPAGLLSLRLDLCRLILDLLDLQPDKTPLSQVMI